MLTQRSGLDVWRDLYFLFTYKFACATKYANCYSFAAVSLRLKSRNEFRVGKRDIMRKDKFEEMRVLESDLPHR